ncbi:MAG: ANTAR domain-containing protein [Alteromonadaceae bacterium]|nr:ANTAR domain-containing protein [Alteromonadaceae bacterium]
MNCLIGMILDLSRHPILFNQTGCLMSQPTCVLVCAEDELNLTQLSEALTTSLYRVKTFAGASAEMLKAIQIESPDALMIASDTDLGSALDALHILRELHPIPVVIFARQYNAVLMEKLIALDISAYVTGDDEWHRAPDVLATAIARFDHAQSLHKELADTKAALASRKFVEQAKAILIEQRGMSEAEAYKTIRKMAMDKGQKIEEVAKTIIDMSHLWLNQFKRLG